MGKNPAKSESGYALYSQCMGKTVTLCTRQGGISTQKFSSAWASAAGCDGLCCTAVGCCNLCLILIRKVLRVLSQLTFEEPVNSGGMLGGIQVVDFSGSEWKSHEQKLLLILFESCVQSEEHLSAYCGAAGSL